MDGRFRRTPVALVLCFGLLLSGCTSVGVGLKAASDTNTSTSPSTTSTQTVEPSAGADATPAIIAPAPNVGGGGDAVSSIGVVLPNLSRTPGATNTSVTQANIGQTICVSGWTSTIRPPSNVTTAMKIRQLVSGYSYQADTLTADYEEDHLISLELGGSPTSEANLWPEPYGSVEGARVKDQLENKLHALVCSGTLPLITAQNAIASNWWVAYETYVASSTGNNSVGPVSGAPPAPAPAPAAAERPAGATALCVDGSYSFAAHHQGACSKHGGVSTFY